MSIKRIKTAKRMSQGVVHANTLYTAGQVAEGANVTEQTQAILQKIEDILSEAGTTKAKLISTMIWMSDISKFQEMNAVWDAWVEEGEAPARACVESKLARDELFVEISVIAAID